MITRITDPEKFKIVIEDCAELFFKENQETGHACDLLHNKETIKASFSNKQLLVYDVFVWANYENGIYDAIGIFILDKSAKFGVEILSEFLWISKNPKQGFKILKKATELARKKNIKYIMLATSAKNPNSPRYERLYKKLGFQKDSTIFIGKL